MPDGDEDIDPEEQQRMTIAQAFADDDVIEEFRQEKDDMIQRDKPKDIDLSLPGWGSWGGEGIKISKRKRKRCVYAIDQSLFVLTDINKMRHIIAVHVFVFGLLFAKCEFSQYNKNKCKFKA